MAESVFALPVSVEQIAVAIKQMSSIEQQHLLELVPDLRQLASQTRSRTRAQAQVTVTQLQKKVFATLNNQLLSPDEPFLGNLTLQQYHALSDEEKAKLWEEETETDIMECEERKVESDAMPVG